MSRHNHSHLAEEHPNNHLYQISILLMYLAVWILDSFFLNISTFLRDSIPIWIHLIIAAVIFSMGIFLSSRTHKIIFKSKKTGLMTEGVFGCVRHPMYLGSILIYVALSIGTLSLLSLIPLIIGFFIYDRMAEYEEKGLEEKLGQEYLEYKKKVPRWFPRLKKKEGKHEPKMNG